LKEEKLIKKQTYMKTETRKLYSGVFWTFLPNDVEIDPYNFELYRFKVKMFFLIHSVVADFIFSFCTSLSVAAFCQ